MTQDFYSTEDRRLALLREARSWINTPCVPHGAAKGSGVDCISFLGEVYIATGFMKAYPKERYAMDEGANLPASRLEQWIDESGLFRPVWSRDSGTKDYVDISRLTSCGDCVTFFSGAMPHHAAIAFGGAVVLHCIHGPGVCYARLNDSILARRVSRIYRPLDIV